MQIEVIEAAPNMCEEVCKLLIRSISQSCRKDHHDDPVLLEAWLENKTPENVKSWLETNRTYCAVFPSGEIVGVLQASLENRILLNYVEPKYSGKGVGTKLLRKLEVEIGSGNKLLVESTETAKPFYIKEGFRAFKNQSNEMFKQISL